MTFSILLNIEIETLFFGFETCLSRFTFAQFIAIPVLNNKFFES